MEQNTMFNIFNVLYDYSIKNQLLDEAAVYEIIRIYLFENGLNGLVSDVYFVDLSSDKTYGYYANKTRIIYLDLNFIKNAAYKRHYSDRFYVNCVNLINQEILIAIFHELNHALRFNLSHDKFDFVDFILKDVWNMAKKDPDVYNKLHDYFPTEKEANIFAFDHCIWLYQYLNRYISDNYGLNDLYLSFLMTIADGYDKDIFLSNPLKKVVLTSKKDSEILRYGKYLLMDKAISAKKMNLYDRLTFGFPIKENEYDYLMEVLNGVKMYEQGDNLDIKALILRK